MLTPTEVLGEFSLTLPLSVSHGSIPMKMISGVLCVISVPRALPGLLAGKMNALFLKLCP